MDESGFIKVVTKHNRGSCENGVTGIECNSPNATAHLTDSSKPKLRKSWTVGTLTYTTGGLSLLFFWLLWGDFALSLRDRSVGPLVQLFLKREGASDTSAAMLLSSLPLFLGMILGPIVSYRSDRFRSRWGRRIPFLMIPTPIAALAMVGIAFSTQIGQLVQQFTGGSQGSHNYTLGVFAIFWTVFEVAVIVSGAVFGGLVNDVVPRPLLGRFYGLFRAVSLIDGMIFNYFLLEWAESHFMLMLVAIAFVFGAGFVLMCLKVREGDYPPVHEFSGPEVHGFFPAAKTYFRECYTQPYYLWCFTAFTLATITFMPVNLFSIFYAKSLNIDMGYYGSLIAGSYVVSLCAAYPLGSLVDRFHALRVGLVAMALYMIATIWSAFAIHDARTFGIGLVAHTVLSGTYFTATASLGQALLPRSKFSQFASAGGILNSIVALGVGPGLGILLDRSGHNYRLTYVIGFVFSCCTLAVLTVVFRRFEALGGRSSYLAPGDVRTEVASTVSA